MLKAKDLNGFGKGGSQQNYPKEPTYPRDTDFQKPQGRPVTPNKTGQGTSFYSLGKSTLYSLISRLSSNWLSRCFKDQSTRYRTFRGCEQFQRSNPKRPPPNQPSTKTLLWRQSWIPQSQRPRTLRPNHPPTLSIPKPTIPKPNRPYRQLFLQPWHQLHKPKRQPKHPPTSHHRRNSANPHQRRNRPRPESHPTYQHTIPPNQPRIPQI